MFKGLFTWLFDEPRDLREWAIQYMYRIDHGLFEFEEDYRKKKKLKLIRKDRTYNQYLGKLVAVVNLMQDFDIRFGTQTFSTRILKRIKSIPSVKLNVKTVFPP